MDYKQAMLIPFERDEDGLLLPVVFRPGSARVNLCRIRHMLGAHDRTSLEELLQNEKHQQALMYAIDLQVREYAVKEGGCTSIDSIEMVWNVITGLGLQVVSGPQADVVEKRYSLLKYLCYERPNTGTVEEREKKEYMRRAALLSSLARLGGGDYVETNVNKGFTMGDLVEGLGSTVMEEIAGVPRHTLQVRLLLLLLLCCCYCYVIVMLCYVYVICFECTLVTV